MKIWLPGKTYLVPCKVCRRGAPAWSNRRPRETRTISVLRAENGPWRRRGRVQNVKKTKKSCVFIVTSVVTVNCRRGYSTETRCRDWDIAGARVTVVGRLAFFSDSIIIVAPPSHLLAAANYTGTQHVFFFLLYLRIAFGRLWNSVGTFVDDQTRPTVITPANVQAKYSSRTENPFWAHLPVSFSSQCPSRWNFLVCTTCVSYLPIIKIFFSFPT